MAPKKAAKKTAVKAATKPAKKAAKKAAPKAAAKAPAKKMALKSPAKKPLKAMKPAKAAAKSVAPKMETAKVSSAKLTMIKGGKSAFLVPLDDRLLVEKLGTSDRTPGGLYIPDSAQERPTKGKVVAVGKGHRDAKGRIRPLDVKVGDVVLFTQWSGNEVEIDGATYLIMRETDLLGVSID